MNILTNNPVLAELVQCHLSELCSHENLTSEEVIKSLNSGQMVLLGNPAHLGLKPVLIGQPARVKVNANIGTSALSSSPSEEMEKLKIALDSGADTVMDLSIAGDLDEIRLSMLKACARPIGTVPLYAVAQKYIDAGKDPALFEAEELLEEIEKQAKQGVDFMTLHCGLTEQNIVHADNAHRVMGIVSRGGSILARWMKNRKKENPLLTGFNEVLNICLKHNVTISLGDGLRPGAGTDAGDTAQWEEVIALGKLALKARAAGVQCMIEGPGHVPMHEVQSQIKTTKRLTHGAPLYVLGPLVIDSSPGYDHISGAIGGALAVQAGVDFLCYLTPAEHLTLPNKEDVRQGVIASRIAAQAGELSLERSWAHERENKMNKARMNLDWSGMQANAIDPSAVCKRRENFAGEEVCAMCGEFCAVKMSRNEKWAPAK